MKRTPLKRRVAFSGLAALLGFGTTLGVLGGVFAASPAGAQGSCDTGIGLSLSAEIYMGSTATPASTQFFARVGDTIQYSVKAQTAATDCLMKTVNIYITPPTGTPMLVATGLTITPGTQTTYFTAPLYTVSPTDVPATSYIRADATATGTATRGTGFLTPATGHTTIRTGVLHPETTLSKMATPTSGTVPLKVKYTFTETNASNTVDPMPNITTKTNRTTIAVTRFFVKDTLHTVTVTDVPVTGGCLPVFTSTTTATSTPTTNKLFPGVTWKYTCTRTFTTTGTYPDTVTATGLAGDTRTAGTSTSTGAPQPETATASVTVNKATPAITTTPTPSTAVVGTTLKDTVTLSTLVNPETGATAGTITVTLFGPTDTSCSGTPVFTTTFPATTGTGTYTSPTGYVATMAGPWQWTAFYSGDANNNTATSPCTAEPVTITKATPAITTTPTPSTADIGTTLKDTVTLSTLTYPETGATAGTITVTLFGPTSTSCSGTPVFTTTFPATTGTGPYTSPTGYVANTAGTWQWTAFYSGDANNNTASSPCGTEPVTVNKATPAITTAPTPSTADLGTTLKDTVTLSTLMNPETGATAGTITVTLFGPTDTSCSGTPAFTTTFPATTGTGTYTNPTGFTVTTAGTWQWTAFYSGDANNNTASSTCGTEPVTVNKATPAITTTPTPSTALVGTTLKDTVTLSTLMYPDMGTTAGTIEVALFGPTDTSCSGTPVFTTTFKAATGTGTYTSPTGYVADMAGTWQWTAFYSGDTNNNTASSPCGTEPVTVNKATPAITTTPTPSTTVVGSTLTDTVTLSTLMYPGLGTTAGTITVALFGPTDTSCSGTPVFTTTFKAATGAGSYTSPTGYVANTAGTWQWTAFYSGDANNNTASSPCGAEPVTVRAPSVMTLTPGYWKNHLTYTGRHPTAPYTEEFLPLPLGTYTVDSTTKAFDVLSNLECRTTGINCLAGQLLATLLNLGNGTDHCITTVVTAAEALLSTVGYHGPGTYKATVSKTQARQAKTLASKLSLYNSDNTGIC